ncbi:MAG: sortase-like acyltransferase, partial [Mycobacterium sp.]|nr:sortase-like acyltransferase [Mycobacterium sp.]
MRQTDILIQRSVPDDLEAISTIYEHHVQSSVATFELTPPDPPEWQRRLRAITGDGLPFLTATKDGRVAGYAYCSPWNVRPAYRYTVEDSIYVAP